MKSKRKASEALEDEEERQRFKEIVDKRLKIEDPLSKRQARIDREKENAKTRGVIYIGHIPHGFYEDELRKYFSQFGEVTRVRVSRSRKTGGSRGYAFVEFLHDSVAKVAAETMNGYLMFDRLLKCQVVPKEKVHSDMFSMRFPFPLNREITRTFINMERTEAREAKNKKLRMRRLKRQLARLTEAGVSCDVSLVNSDGEKKLKGNKASNKEQHNLVVDSDDDEIQFKTPPNAKRVKKKSLKPTSSTPLTTKKQEKVKTPKATPVPKSLAKTEVAKKGKAKQSAKKRASAV